MTCLLPCLSVVAMPWLSRGLQPLFSCKQSAQMKRSSMTYGPFTMLPPETFSSSTTYCSTLHTNHGTTNRDINVLLNQVKMQQLSTADWTRAVGDIFNIKTEQSKLERQKRKSRAITKHRLLTSDGLFQAKKEGRKRKERRKLN